MFKKILFTFLLIIPIGLKAQQLVYKPVNPAFGGETFNYQWLLNSATAQNSIEDPNASAREDEAGALSQFTEALNRQLLSQISREAFGSQFREDGLQPGTFTFGSLEIEVLETLDGLVINILDTSTAEQTQIIVPNQ